jgi:hypothetical protein
MTAHDEFKKGVDKMYFFCLAVIAIYNFLGSMGLKQGSLKR